MYYSTSCAELEYGVVFSPQHEVRVICSQLEEALSSSDYDAKFEHHHLPQHHVCTLTLEMRTLL
jgi:hypothetical protein